MSFGLSRHSFFDDPFHITSLWTNDSPGNLKLSFIINLNIISASKLILFARNIGWIFRVLWLILTKAFTDGFPVESLNKIMNLTCYIRVIATVMNPVWSQIPSSSFEDDCSQQFPAYICIEKSVKEQISLASVLVQNNSVELAEFHSQSVNISFIKLSSSLSLKFVLR